MKNTYYLLWLGLVIGIIIGATFGYFSLKNVSQKCDNNVINNVDSISDNKDEENNTIDEKETYTEITDISQLPSKMNKDIVEEKALKMDDYIHNNFKDFKVISEYNETIEYTINCLSYFENKCEKIEVKYNNLNYIINYSEESGCDLGNFVYYYKNYIFFVSEEECTGSGSFQIFDLKGKALYTALNTYNWSNNIVNNKYYFIEVDKDNKKYFKSIDLDNKYLVSETVKELKDY